MRTFSSCTASANFSESVIHSCAKPHGVMSVLLKTSTKGSFSLYMIEHAYSMLLMKVTGAAARGVSTTYTTTVGNEYASMSEMMDPAGGTRKLSFEQPSRAHSACESHLPAPPRTKWTRRVPHPVLIGHAASLTPY